MLSGQPVIGSAAPFEADDPSADSNDDHHEQTEFEYPCERTHQPLDQGDPSENGQRSDDDNRRKGQPSGFL